MKKVFCLTLIIFFGSQLFAQDYSFNKFNTNKFYIDISGKTMPLNGNWGLMGGMKAGYNINEKITVGLFVYGLIPDKIEKNYINQEGKDELNMGYTGFEVAYNHILSNKFSLTGNMLIGAAKVEYQDLGGEDYFFIAEPGVGINYKLTDWFNLVYTVSFRFASGVKYSDFSNNSFSGLANDLSLRFGF